MTGMKCNNTGKKPIDLQTLVGVSDVIVIRPNGRTTTARSLTKNVELSWMQEVVEGQVEQIPSFDIKTHDIFANEDGKLLKLKFNAVASKLIDFALYGTILIVKKGLVK